MLDLQEAADYANALNKLSLTIHDANVKAGWWDDAKFTRVYDTVPHPLKNALILAKYVIPTKLALVHSEISEALEGYRKNLMDDHLPDRKMIEVELADALIRIFDLAGALELDLGGALVEKFNYNQHRPDHKPEARNAPGGKSV